MLPGFLRRLCALLLLAAAPAAFAQTYVFELDTAQLEAKPVDLPDPVFPGSGFRTGQEGWVQMNFVVRPDGTVADPIVVHSVGGPAFEAAARDALARWRFEPVDVEIPYNVVEMRFELRRGRDAATSNFLRRYRRIMTHVFEEETELARRQVDQAVALGGWNLYEETMLALMVGRVEGQEGDIDAKLKYYLRAMALANRSALDGQDRRDALSRIFQLQHFRGQYGSALRTLEILRNQPRGSRDADALQPKVDEVMAALASPAAYTVSGQLLAPCDCDAGQALWYYRPARREFSFASADGNVGAYEARCRSARIAGEVSIGERIVLPESPERCELFVFGDDGTRIELLEHVSDDAVARVTSDYGLDRDNR